MTDHLLWSTFTAAAALAVAWMLRRQPAATRYWLLLAAMLRFAVPTQWLTAAGAGLGKLWWREPIHLPALQFNATPILAAPTAHAAPVASPQWNFAAILWATGALVFLLLYLRRAFRTIPSVRRASDSEQAAMDQAWNRLQLSMRVTLKI
ncbi:MAG: hypothetical protein ABI995_11045, partial [Acidobacteriota bacterium]